MFIKAQAHTVFENALEYCQSVDNNYVYSDQGTAQDICIDEYMNAPWALELVNKNILTIWIFYLLYHSFYI